jgi:hypothetical protein
MRSVPLFRKVPVCNLAASSANGFGADFFGTGGALSRWLGQKRLKLQTAIRQRSAHKWKFQLADDQQKMHCRQEHTHDE